ncbi:MULTISPECIES: alanine dehydrogenase [Prochlorococcus]|uniref:Alanine dehydrogenase n=1 Tax=Prochlorococcus marinus (strain SARG / CCMP1375 / SS120) TaxID=167539 RepID=Q7VA67_PROMA|nr:MULTISPECIES: alanine dehydrogenase [Prochlorococcus]AAQ00644.1 Alanine dehydrogenase [Prochlorococcus marinus subsp. marinus str. CCMP1375]KGG10861.1 Alanine dehydrogenase [Prochlorococcus marinus str. LG]KGG20441.1 Alanine dehydrogenase [Prochlorococcus marinus str. SS2]KGG24110.1 Alanine dehydrogenase [Prochlorococcus marinus str. SS35]KGG31633.1 Alanine dehydrogenase [Prochlorococcus marinus str. SS51]
MPSPVLSAPISSIGIPKEIKSDELRVAITPDGVKELVTQGLEVRVQTDAGKGLGIEDQDFSNAGARIVDRDEAWAAHLVVKVKEPQEEEFKFLREDMVLFTYLHLAAYPKVSEALLTAGTTTIGYETVQMEDGSLPLLAPMSEIAGRLAAQVGANLLEKPNGGRGILIGGCTGVRPARVIVLGAGTVGWNAARLAAAMDAEVMLLDRSPERLRKLEAYRKGRLESIVSSRGLLERLIPTADLIIGAVLTPGGRAPTLVDENMVAQMKNNSVIVDVAIDQGGCVATSVETTHTKPTINIKGVQHYAVSNMPGAVPFTSTEALVSVTLPYILGIAGRGLEGAITERPEIVSGLNTIGGSVCHPGVAKALGIPPRHPMACLN